ncbi:TVP38/TMEM64 family protein [Flaviaesturariibacter amylovorans]|uniref:TVP38/TMEM64 family membrane protein n=1 Tax=Flaviaesturariibacter amylovorans TaxID=1084520 RepID=A0ABP8HW22_9BACT
MKETLIDLFGQYPQAALVLSLLASVLVAVLGLLPSVFITAANILFFGFWKGTAISFAGEALGAVVSFWLYRKGFRKGAAPAFARYPKAQRLLDAQGREAFGLVLSLRLLPFVPSGLVTFAAAIGRVSAGTFVLASSLGKAPALLLEAWSVQKVTEGSIAGKIILAVVAVVILYLLLRKKPRS